MNLGFVVERRGETDVVVWDDGGVSPASIPTAVLWRYVGVLREAITATVTEPSTALDWEAVRCSNLDRLRSLVGLDRQERP
jgi:hypothetical protein